MVYILQSLHCPNGREEHTHKLTTLSILLSFGRALLEFAVLFAQTPQVSQGCCPMTRPRILDLGNRIRDQFRDRVLPSPSAEQPAQNTTALWPI